MPWTTIVALLGVALTPFVTYLIAVRHTSGSIKTTDAATLWQEAENMREAYKEEAAALRLEVVALRKEAVATRDELVNMRDAAIKCHTQLASLQAEMKAFLDKQ